MFLRLYIFTGSQKFYFDSHEYAICKLGILHCELKFTDAWKICLINVQTIVTSLDCILNESMPSQDQG